MPTINKRKPGLAGGPSGPDGEVSPVRPIVPSIDNGESAGSEELPCVYERSVASAAQSGKAVPTQAVLRQASVPRQVDAADKRAMYVTAPIDLESASAVNDLGARLDELAETGRKRYSDLLSKISDDVTKKMLSFTMSVDPFGLCCGRYGELIAGGSPQNIGGIGGAEGHEALKTLLGPTPDFETILRNFDMAGCTHRPVESIRIAFRDSEGEQAEGVVATLIHNIWLGGPLTDELRRENIAKLARYNPSFQSILWTDQLPDSPGFAEMKAWAQRSGIALLPIAEVLGGERDTPLFAIKNLETLLWQWGAVSDILRVHLMNLFGGVYVDGDNHVIDPPGDGLPEPGKISTIAPERMLQQAGFACPMSSNGRPSNNDVLVSVRNHPICKAYTRKVVDAYSSAHIDEEEVKALGASEAMRRLIRYHERRPITNDEIDRQHRTLSTKVRVVRQTGPVVLQGATWGWACANALGLGSSHSECAFVEEGGKNGSYLRLPIRTPNGTLEEEITGLFAYAHDCFEKWKNDPPMGEGTEFQQRLARINDLGCLPRDLANFIERFGGSRVPGWPRARAHEGGVGEHWLLKLKRASERSGGV